MISAFDVYLVMQLDRIGGALTLVCLGAFVVGGVTGAVYAALGGPSAADSDEDAARMVTMLKVFKVCAWTAAIIIPLSALLPSTKTAAAMIILPAMTSDKVIEAVKPEARELLDLTKEALRGLSKQKPSEPEGD